MEIRNPTSYRLKVGMGGEEMGESRGGEREREIDLVERNIPCDFSKFPNLSGSQLLYL